MKKLLLFAVVATLFAACTQEVVVDVTNPSIADDAPETLTMGFEGDDTRIQLNEAQKTVWTKGDQVSVFYRSNANQKWQYQGETGERTAVLKRVDAGNATETMKRVVVVYPYNKNYYINTETYNVQASLPAVQHYLKDSYGLDGNIMISSAEYNDVTLKNVCGWLKLQLTGNGEVVKSIKFRGNNGEQVAGELYINSADATAILASDMGNIAEDEGENATGGAGANLSFDGVVLKKVTLDCGEGVTLGAEATAFYIALPPQTFEKGFTVDVECDGYYPMTLSTENALTIERNHIQPMSVIEVEAEAEVDWFQLSVFVTNEYVADGFYSYNSLFYTMKGQDVVAVSVMVTRAEDADNLTTDEILSQLRTLGAYSIAQINSTEGLFDVVSGCPAETEIVFFALAENADGDTVLVRKSATTTGVIVPDFMKAWMGTYEATIENYYKYDVDGSYEATYGNYYKFDEDFSAGYEPTTDKFEFVVGFDEDMGGLYVDGFSVMGGGWPTLAGVDEEGNLAIYSGIYLREDQGYTYVWLTMGNLYEQTADGLVPVEDEQGKFYIQSPSHYLVNNGGSYSCNAAEYNLGDGTVLKVVFNDIFALDGHLSPYFIIDAWPVRYRAGNFAVKKISDEVKDLTAN